MMEEGGSFCRLLIFFQNQLFSKISSRNTIRVSKSWDPDQVRHIVGPDLDPNCLQMLSADDTSRQRVQQDLVFYHFITNEEGKVLWCSKLAIGSVIVHRHPSSIPLGQS